MCSIVTSAHFRGRFEAQVSLWKGFEELTWTCMARSILASLAAQTFLVIDTASVLNIRFRPPLLVVDPSSRMLILLHLLGDIAFLGGILMQLYTFLSPIPWFSDNPNNSLLKFVPYEEPSGYVPPNACPGGQLSNSTIFKVKTSQPLPRDEPILRFRRFADLAPVEPEVAKRESNTANYSQAAIWMGALGSCNRDVDGKVYCTKPSYSNPQYNLTHIQPNSVYFSAMIPNVTHPRLILATIALNVVGYLLFVLGSFPFWFPRTYASLFGTGNPQTLPGFAIFFLALSWITEFIMNFCIEVGGVGSYNSIDNFYNPAPCGQPRPLKSGVLLKAGHGRLYNMIWGGWCLIFLFGAWFLILRMALIPDRIKDGLGEHNTRASRKAAKKEEKVKAKEEKEFREKVEKEKIAMAAREELDKEKALAELAESKSISSDGTEKTLILSTPLAPLTVQ